LQVDQLSNIQLPGSAKFNVRKGYEMKILSMTVLGIVITMSPTTLFAQTQTYRATGTAAIAAGSVNPPNPIDGCNRAKQDATTKAATAGFIGRVVWDHLSNDSDCKLQTSGARGAGYFYIFTASGTFDK
jgi:hypothetical protein